MTCSLIFRNENCKRELEPLCTRILQQYILPEESLYCIFDDKERSEFIQFPGFGSKYCGFFWPVKRYGIDDGIWPWEIVDHFSNVSQGVAFLCDVVIYLRKRTCDSRTGITITFAHELQHFMQYAYKFKIWRANAYLQDAAVPKLTNPHPWDFPVEYEAQFVSKLVAESIIGREEVNRYAIDQISNCDDPEKWKFFLGLDTSQSFDLLEETKHWVQKYKNDIIEKHPDMHRRSSDPDFTKDDWWN